MGDIIAEEKSKAGAQMKSKARRAHQKSRARAQLKCWSRAQLKSRARAQLKCRARAQLKSRGASEKVEPGAPNADTSPPICFRDRDACHDGTLADAVSADKLHGAIQIITEVASDLSLQVSLQEIREHVSEL